MSEARQDNPASSYPLVSFIVITRNRLGELAGCLENIERQTYPRRELVVVDNGSVDGSQAWIRQRHPDARLVDAGTNLGVAGGRNLGVSAASGRYLLFIDDDARFAEVDAAKEAVARFETDPRLAALSFTIRNAANGEIDRKSIPRRDKRGRAGDYFCSYFCGAGFALRSGAIRDLGPFWEPLFYGVEEIDLSLRLLDAGHHIVHTDAISVVHREVPHGRPKHQWVYYHTRNRCWVGARNLPWPNVVSTTVLWWGRTGLVALRAGHLTAWARGVVDSLRGLPVAVEHRRRISRDTLNRVSELSGRGWY